MNKKVLLTFLMAPLLVIPSCGGGGGSSEGDSGNTTQQSHGNDEIKAYMGDEETMMAGSYKVTWKETVSRRVDTAALKKVLGDALEEYTKTITTRPFKVS